MTETTARVRVNKNPENAHQILMGFLTESGREDLAIKWTDMEPNSEMLDYLLQKGYRSLANAWAKAVLPFDSEYIEKIHEDYTKLVHSISSGFRKSLPFFSFQEIVSEAWFSVLINLRKHDATKSALSTFITFTVSNTLRTSVQQFQKQKPVWGEMGEDMEGEIPMERSQQFDLSPDAQLVVAAIEGAEGELAKGLDTRKHPAKKRTMLRNHLLDNGWDDVRIDIAFEELTELLQ